MAQPCMGFCWPSHPHSSAGASRTQGSTGMASPHVGPRSKAVSAMSLRYLGLHK